MDVDNLNTNVIHWSNLLFLTAYIVLLFAFLLLMLGVTLNDPTDKPAKSKSTKTTADKMNDSGYLVTILATVFLGISLLLRGIAAHRLPWGNLFEFLTLSSFAGLVVALVLLAKRALHIILAFVVAAILILLFFAGKKLDSTAAPIMPALKNYWLGIHVTVISLGTGILLVSGLISILYLLKITFPKLATQSNSRLGKIFKNLPTADKLISLAYRSVVFAFPIYGIGIVCGAIWAEAAWGRFWNWDPKEIASFVSWIIYAGFLHAQNTAGWQGKRAAIINVIGFLSIIVNLFVINFATHGMHSYA